MRSTSLVTAAVAITVTGSVLLASSPSQGTRAQWSASTTTTMSGPSSDTFAMTARDLPDTGPLDWPTQPSRWRNAPQITLTNTSRRQSSWINVSSTRVEKAVPGDTNTLLQRMALDYTIGSGNGTCGDGTQSTYWTALGVGGFTPGTAYERPTSKVSGATLPTGGSKVLCPLVKLNYVTDTTAGQRQALLNHAGRALNITTVVNQRSEVPARWGSPDQTVTSRFRMAMPTPVRPQENTNVCRRTTSSGSPSSAGYYGGFFWAWPDAVTSSSTTTPAMAGGWQILRRRANTSDPWQVWKSESNSDVRAIAGINSDQISSNLGEVWEFKLRGYPFDGDSTRYVESAWIARASNTRPLLITRWQCHYPGPNDTWDDNPNAGPHNMP